MTGEGYQEEVLECTVKIGKLEIWYFLLKILTWQYVLELWLTDFLIKCIIRHINICYSWQKWNLLWYNKSESKFILRTHVARSMNTCLFLFSFLLPLWKVVQEKKDNLISVAASPLTVHCLHSWLISEFQVIR